MQLTDLHRWWLARYTPEQIRELADAVGGPLHLTVAERERRRWVRATAARRARASERAAA